eukprot:6182734-Lingulodinium_polyedra.AAC.1
MPLDDRRSPCWWRGLCEDQGPLCDRRQSLPQGVAGLRLGRDSGLHQQCGAVRPWPPGTFLRGRQ